MQYSEIQPNNDFCVFDLSLYDLIEVYLQVVSYVTQSMSIISLMITFFILFLVRKKVKSNRVHIQLNLLLSLTFFHIISIFHDLVLLHTRSCEVAAVLLHFFLLATGESS